MEKIRNSFPSLLLNNIFVCYFFVNKYSCIPFLLFLIYIYNFLKVLSHFFIKKVNLNKYFFDKDILSKSKLFIQIISFSLIFFNSIRKINIK